MNLFLYSSDDNFIKEFSHQVNLISPQQADVIFIDWIPNVSQSILKKHKAFKKNQTFIIFDRFLSIEIDEANDYRKKGYILIEPALNFRRKYFHYVPFWTKIKSIDDIKLNEGPDRQYDLIYIGNLQGKKASFNQYYVEYAKSYPKTVFYEDQKSINQLESESYANHGIVKIHNNLSYSDAKSTLIIGSPLDYEIGYLDYHIFDALDNNCIPLMVNEYKYFSLLSPYRINDPVFDINYMVSGYKSTYIGYIYDIYLYIKKYYPEMIIENVVKQILDFVK